jgi:hypothetical protein
MTTEQCHRGPNSRLSLGLLAAAMWINAPAAALGQQTAQAARPTRVVTFAKDVAPILQEKCQVCHRPGQMGPMSLVTYETSRPWARSIKARVASRNMPPWHLDKTVGIQKFANDSSLTDAQIDTIVRWVDGGAPLGNPKDLPPPKQWPDESGWRLTEELGRAPDLVVKSAPFTMRPGSEDAWWMPISDTPPMSEDRWVKAIEQKPSLKGRKIVHHAVTRVFQKEDSAILKAERAMLRGEITVDQVLATAGQPTGELVDAGPPEGIYFSEWAVGKAGNVYADGTGKLLKAGAKIGFDIHYSAANADEEITDSIETGIWLYPKGYVPKHRVYFVGMGGTGDRASMEIPPNKVAVNYGYYVLPQPAILQNYQPHMHLRGKAMLMEAIYPNNRVEVLNYVPDFDFNWHVNYIYADDAAPVLPKGTVIKLTAWHDNTAGRRGNPDPSQWVTWGQRSVDDMIVQIAEVVFLTEADYQRIIAERRKKLTN